MHNQKISRSYILLSAWNNVAYGMMFIALGAYFVRTVGMSPLQLVLVGTATELSAFVFEIPTGVFADVYGRKRSVLVGGFLSATCFLLTGLVPTFWLAAVMGACWGLGGTFISGALQAWYTDEIGVERVQSVFLRAAQAESIGSVLGHLFGILLATLVNYQVAIVVGALLLFAQFAYQHLVVPETQFKRQLATSTFSFQPMLNTFKGGWLAVRASSVLLILIAIEFFAGAASEGFDRLNEAHFLQNLNMPALALPVIGTLDSIAWFGIIAALGTVLTVTVIEIAKRGLEKTTSGSPSRRTVFLLMGLETVFVCATIAFAYAQNFPLAVAAVLVRGAASALVFPILQAWQNQHIPSAVRATVLSMSSQTNALGQVVGGPGVGWVGNVFGLRSAIALAGILLAPAVLLYARTLRQKM